MWQPGPHLRGGTDQLRPRPSKDPRGISDEASADPRPGQGHGPPGVLRRGVERAQQPGPRVTPSKLPSSRTRPMPCVNRATAARSSPGISKILQTWPAYEKEYEKALNPVPTIWGVHPYYSVEEKSEAPLLKLVENLPHNGAGDHIWFTEIAARACTNYRGSPVDNGEAGQAERARWLVNSLIANRKPDHVFYFVFLLAEHRRPSCSTERKTRRSIGRRAIRRPRRPSPGGKLYLGRGSRDATHRLRRTAGVFTTGKR